MLQLDFQLASEEGDMSTFIPNGEWALLGRNNSHLKIEILKILQNYEISLPAVINFNSAPYSFLPGIFSQDIPGLR